MYIALRLLRDGAHTTITTRFPRDAVRRFTSLPDSAEWIAPPARRRHRPARPRPGDRARRLRRRGRARSTSSSTTPTQTVRRSPGAYQPLVGCRARAAARRPAARAGDLRAHQRRAPAGARSSRSTAHPILAAAAAPQADELTEQAMAAGLVVARAARGRHRDRRGRARARPARRQLLDAVASTQVDPLEMLEVQLANTTAPFLLISRCARRWRRRTARRKYVVNVSAMEGVFGRGYKGPGHPHTNMAKAARQHAHAHERRARCSRPTAS